MTNLVTRIISGNLKYVELSGLSTEVKPTENIATGSLYHEVDTKIIYAFNATSGEWTEQLDLGGVEA